MFAELYDKAIRFLTTERTVDAARATMLLAITLLVARFCGRAMRRLLLREEDPQRAVLVGRLVTWGIFALGLAGALEELGFKLSVVLGAAGVLTVAIGFAAQTTLSNLISGFFLFGERPFRIGDFIEIDGISGDVLSIDMMATTLRTLDNRFVRIPNELVIKTKVQNHTRFPLRRVDLTVPLGHHEDFARVRAILLEVADQSPLCLAEPSPSVFISGFGETSVQVQVWLWTRTEKMQELRATIGPEIQRALAGVRRIGPAASPG